MSHGDAGGDVAVAEVPLIGERVVDAGVAGAAAVEQHRSPLKVRGHRGGNGDRRQVVGRDGGGGERLPPVAVVGQDAHGVGPLIVPDVRDAGRLAHGVEDAVVLPVEGVGQGVAAHIGGADHQGHRRPLAHGAVVGHAENGGSHVAHGDVDGVYGLSPVVVSHAQGGDDARRPIRVNDGSGGAHDIGGKDEAVVIQVPGVGQGIEDSRIGGGAAEGDQVAFAGGLVGAGVHDGRQVGHTGEEVGFGHTAVVVLCAEADQVIAVVQIGVTWVQRACLLRAVAEVPVIKEHIVSRVFDRGREGDFLPFAGLSIAAGVDSGGHVAHADGGGVGGDPPGRIYGLNAYDVVTLVVKHRKGGTPPGVVVLSIVVQVPGKGNGFQGRIGEPGDQRNGAALWPGVGSPRVYHEGDRLGRGGEGGAGTETGRNSGRDLSHRSER